MPKAIPTPKILLTALLALVLAVLAWAFRYQTVSMAHGGIYRINHLTGVVEYCIGLKTVYRDAIGAADDLVCLRVGGVDRP